MGDCQEFSPELVAVGMKRDCGYLATVLVRLLPSYSASTDEEYFKTAGKGPCKTQARKKYIQGIKGAWILG